MIYKIFTLSYKPDYTYYNKGGVWYKKSRLKPLDGWVRSDSEGQKVLNKEFAKERKMIGWNYNFTTKLVAVTVAVVGIYSAYKFVNK
jgi:hypothetical protein